MNNVSIHSVGSLRRFAAQGDLATRVTAPKRIDVQSSKPRAASPIASALTGLARQTVMRTYKMLRRSGKMIRPLFRHISTATDRILRSPAFGGRLLALNVGCAGRRYRLPAEVLATAMRYGLAVAVQIHLAAANRERAIRVARLANLIFRPEIRARRGLAAMLYFQTLFLCERYDRIAREARSPEDVNGYFLNYVFGVSHLYSLSAKPAQYFLNRAIQMQQDAEGMAHRKLGCAFLIDNDIAQAASNFQQSAAIDYRNVMAHQNYAARYDADAYSPPQWELANAGELMIYDNLVQLGEEFYRQGQIDCALQFYQRGFEYQDVVQAKHPMPDSLVRKIAAACPLFNPDLPIRLLGYEWVTQIGHIGFLDHYMRVARLGLGLIPKANYVLMAPTHKIANKAMFEYWRDFYCVVDDEELIAELFPYQRAVGDQFIAVRNTGRLAMPLQHLAAHAQYEWAEQKRAPLIRLNDEDRAFGHKVLSGLGLAADDWYVSLHVREGGFYGDGPGTIAAHRSADIKDYIEAIEEITGRGGWVFRLGDKSMTKLPRMTRVIDYAHSDEKSARMDVFLFASSRFVIGTTSGPTFAVQSFGTPILVTNAISNDSQPWTTNTNFMLKRIYDRRHGRYLSLQEIYRQPLRSYLINNELLRRHGYEARSNTPQELKEAVQEMLDTGAGWSNGAPGDAQLMQNYRAAIADYPYLFGAARPALPFLKAMMNTA